jgi:hypothetical protein
MLRKVTTMLVVIAAMLVLGSGIALAMTTSTVVKVRTGP